MFDVKTFLDEYKIPHATEGPNTQSGWINIDCPYPDCDDHTNHGGFNLADPRYNCWKCGFHHLRDVIAVLLNISRKDAQRVITEYDVPSLGAGVGKEIIRSKRGMLQLPDGTGPLKKMHKDYLRKRNFDPDKLVSVWDLKGTKQLGDYKYRIIAPIYYRGKLVSYQGRDVTDQSFARYKACAKEDELVHHKYILYGLDHVQYKTMIIVEGITDAWRIGKGACATFGTSLTRRQIRVIKRNAERAFIVFDPDEAGMEKADKLSWELSLLGIDVEVIDIAPIEDPGSMTGKQATYLRKNLISY